MQATLLATLGPTTEGHWNVGAGVYNIALPAANYFISGGEKYFWLGDAEAQPASMFRYRKLGGTI